MPAEGFRPRQREEMPVSDTTFVSTSMSRLLPTEVNGFGLLAELALDLRWSWSHAADDVWRRLDPTLWDRTRNPWAILQTVSQDEFQHMAADYGRRHFSRRDTRSVCRGRGAALGRSTRSPRGSSIATIPLARRTT